MNVRVRLFAAARQAADREWVDLELPPGATVGELRNRLGIRVPQLSSLMDQMMFAVARQYARDNAVIPPGAEVACIPPVSGG